MDTARGTKQHSLNDSIASTLEVKLGFPRHQAARFLNYNMKLVNSFQVLVLLTSTGKCYQHAK